MSRTYLDHNATSPLRPEARDAMLAALALPGNASSVHGEGRRVRALIDAARERIADLAGVRAKDVVFTSGATEAGNWALAAGLKTLGTRQLIVSAVEHDAILAPARALAARGEADLTVLQVDATGRVDIEALAETLDRADTPPLVAMMAANNETGVLQPLSEAAAMVRAAGGLMLVDAVQAAGKANMAPIAAAADFMLLSAHKMGGPAGVGALVVPADREAAPLILGGGQELKRRAGTENVAGIAGFAAAFEAASRDDMGRLAHLRDGMERTLSTALPNLVVFGAGADRLPTTSLVGLDGAPAETLLMSLDLKGFAVSSGSACSSGKVGMSHVLEAMGVAPELARTAIRISLGWSTAQDDVDRFASAYVQTAGRLSEKYVAGVPSALRAAG